MGHRAIETRPEGRGQHVAVAEGSCQLESLPVAPIDLDRMALTIYDPVLRHVLAAVKVQLQYLVAQLIRATRGKYLHHQLWGESNNAFSAALEAYRCPTVGCRNTYNSPSMFSYRTPGRLGSPRDRRR